MTLDMFKDLSSYIHTLSRKVKLGYNSLSRMLADSPKVSGYLPPAAYNIPPALYDQLIAFKAKRGLQSNEIAVTVILSEYFGLLQTPATSTTDTTASSLKTLEAKCTSLSETVAELGTALTVLLASSSQSRDYQKLPAGKQQPLPLQDAHTAAESAISPLVHQSESLEPAIVSSSQVNQSEPEQLAFLNTSTAAQPTINLPEEHTEALDLTAASASFSRAKDNEPEPAPSRQEQQHIEKQSGETSSTPMTQAALAKRLGLATSTISRMQSKSNFSEWSQQRDPEKIAWVKSPETKLFYPQTI